MSLSSRYTYRCGVFPSLSGTSVSATSRTVFPLMRSERWSMQSCFVIARLCGVVMPSKPTLVPSSSWMRSVPKTAATLTVSPDWANVERQEKSSTQASHRTGLIIVLRVWIEELLTQFGAKNTALAGKSKRGHGSENKPLPIPIHADFLDRGRHSPAPLPHCWTTTSLDIPSSFCYHRISL